MSRITLTLDPIEKKALSVLAEREFRDPRAQAALIIRQELERHGLLQAEPILVTVPPTDNPIQNGGKTHVTDQHPK